jgi:aryl carrier-like protein
MLPDPVIRMTQFYRQKDDGTQFRGTCGQTALAVCIAAARGTPSDFEGVGELMIHLTRAMIARGLAAPNGASRLAALAEQARTEGCAVALELTYQEPLLADWRMLLREYAGAQPIVLQVACGEALRDAETGAHDDVGLRYHAIAIVGQRADAYIAADSDNPDIMRRLQVYTEATLAEAMPCGLLMLAMGDGA